MQQQFLQVFHHAFSLIKIVIYIVFTLMLGNDLRHVYSLVETGIVLAAVLAALAIFDPIVNIVLQASLIALVVLVAHGDCSNPTLETGVRACVTTGWGMAFEAITDVIHRLLALLLPHHTFPKVIQAYLLIPPVASCQHLPALHRLLFISFEFIEPEKPQPSRIHRTREISLRHQFAIQPHFRSAAVTGEQLFGGDVNRPGRDRDWRLMFDLFSNYVFRGCYSTRLGLWHFERSLNRLKEALDTSRPRFPKRSKERSRLNNGYFFRHGSELI
jgi:hypothetical protein